MYLGLLHAGLLEDAGGASKEETVWKWLEARWEHPRIGYRIKLCEDMRLHRCLKDHVETWTAILFEREVLGLEMDSLDGSDFNKKIGDVSC